MRNLVIPFIAILISTSCNILDVDPSDSVEFDNAITSENDLKSAIIGCYDAFQASGYYGRDFIILGDLTADNLAWAGTTVDYSQFQQNNLNAANTIVDAVWASIYDAINRINFTLSKIDGITSFDDEDKAKYKGELRFLRGICYFDLAKVFGGVPIRLQPTLSPNDIPMARSTVAQTYQQAVADLTFASLNLKPVYEVEKEYKYIKANATSAKALLARVYLYHFSISQNATDLDSAVFLANEVISGTLSEPFAELFPANEHPESIFELTFSVQDPTRISQYLLPTSLGGRREMASADSLEDIYSEGDARKEVSIKTHNENKYCGKYLDVAGGTDHIYIIRLAELYLIRAEANNLRGRPASEILPDIEAVRTRAGLTTPLAISTSEEIALAIETERRLEFLFEGHRWFDLTRTNRAMAVKETVTSPNQYLFPIPLNEILYNTSFGAQNNGY